MRKDFMVDTVSGGADETAFVEAYWTRVWEQEGGPKDAGKEIPKKPEFRIMRPYLDQLPKGARLLDGGCGLGNWTLYFERNELPTLGLDISRDTVTKLKSLFPEVNFAVGDIRDTALPAESFDGYFSWGTFEHFEDGLDRCVAEAWRILKPGGYLFITVPFDNLRQSLIKAFDAKRETEPNHQPVRFYQWRLTRGELRDCLRSGGFQVLDIKPIHKRQGILRSLHHEFGMSYKWTVTKALSALLAPFLPGIVFSHMIMAVARKPAAPG
jgi:SAM-dependent methyltransferase